MCKLFKKRKGSVISKWEVQAHTQFWSQFKVSFQVALPSLKLYN